MQLPTCSVALVAIVLGTSAWAEASAVPVTSFVDSHEEASLAQFLAADLMGTAEAALAKVEEASEADAIAAIVDGIVRNTVLIGNPAPWVAELGPVVAASAESDPTEVTGSIEQVKVALDGLEDH